jgi:gamma-glutamyltranspeptidase/glutathione hydrolase
MPRLSALAVFLLLTHPLAAQVISPATQSGRSTVYAPRGVAATSQPLATGAALRILEEGGNAIDAAVAAAAVLNVTEPYMTGMGGDMFAILWSADEERLVGMDASGKSGSRASAQALIDAGENRPYRGARAVTVPGALSGWSALVERYGTMTLADLLEPAIRIAEEGFPVTPIIARDWAGTVDVLRRNDGAASTYLIDGERAPAAGEWFSNPDLARTFRRIAQNGIEDFYGGALGREVIAGLDELGGYLTLEDLARHEMRWVDPLSMEYKGYTLWELPPAGQGVAALEMLKMLEGFDLRAMGHNSADYLHTLIEAKKLAYVDLQEYVADPDYMEVKVEELLDPDYIARRAALIDPTTAADRPAPGRLVTESETIYLTVADEHGNMISFINSIYEYFGSGVVIPGTGFMLQNRGAGFTIEEGPNQIGPGKRPFHTIIPAFVTKEGQPWLSYGVMGGSMQPQGHVQLLLNLVEFGMDLQEAVDAPRFRHFSGTTVAIENLPADVARALEARGHELRDPNGVAFGGAQAIMRLARGWAAGSDPRKDGMAAGH